MQGVKASLAAMPNTPETDAVRIHWLCGAIVTPLNMFVCPALWYAALLALLIYSWVLSGHPPDVRKLGFVGIFVLAITVFITFVSARIKRVGAADGHLVVSNYRRTICVPFRQVEAVELVWWYWRRLVRVRFRSGTALGDVVYYLPPWAGIRCFFVDPAQDLRELMLEHETLASWSGR